MPPMSSGRMRPQNTKELIELRDAMLMRFSRVAKGWKFTMYRCNHCRHLIPSECPKRQDVGSKGYWDSLTTCLSCGRMNFVLVWPSGRTVSRKFMGDGDKTEVETRQVPVSYAIISKLVLK